MDSDNPVREVEVASFWLSACEVTVEQFQSLPITNDSKQSGGDSPSTSKLQLPVANVSWYDAVNFCNLLSEHEGFPSPYYYEISDILRGSDGRIKSAKVKSGVGHGYRLPTEVEWEVACRAGTTTEYSFGNGERELGDYGWYASNSDGAKPVASKRPNPWGLHDMHGNLWEWCEDEYTVDAERVYRGGSWNCSAFGCRSAYCSRGTRAYPDVGFRLSLVLSRGD